MSTGMIAWLTYFIEIITWPCLALVVCFRCSTCAFRLQRTLCICFVLIFFFSWATCGTGRPRDKTKGEGDKEGTETKDASSGAQNSLGKESETKDHSPEAPEASETKESETKEAQEASETQKSETKEAQTNLNEASETQGGSAAPSNPHRDRYERLSLPRGRREEIGRKVKRVLDFARADFARERLGRTDGRNNRFPILKRSSLFLKTYQ